MTDWRNATEPPQLRWTRKGEDLDAIPSKNKYSIFGNGDCVISKKKCNYESIARVAIRVDVDFKELSEKIHFALFGEIDPQGDNYSAETIQKVLEDENR